jgi:hypothetical protein
VSARVIFACSRREVPAAPPARPGSWTSTIAADAFVATVQQGGVEHFVGVARYCETDEAVLRNWASASRMGRGNAPALAACCCGSSSLMRGSNTSVRLIGLVLPDNEPMIALARRLGSPCATSRQHLFVMSREITPLRRESVHLHQVRDRARSHRLHDVGAVNFHGALAQAEVSIAMTLFALPSTTWPMTSRSRGVSAPLVASGRQGDRRSRDSVRLL